MRAMPSTKLSRRRILRTSPIALVGLADCLIARVVRSNDELVTTVTDY